MGKSGDKMGAIRDEGPPRNSSQIGIKDNITLPSKNLDVFSWPWLVDNFLRFGRIIYLG